MFKTISKTLLTLGLTGLLAGAALAQTTPPTRIRGTIESLNDRTLTIKSRDGQTLTVTLAENFTVSTVKKVDLATVADGTYIGTASRTEAGGQQAIEVLVFPETMRGTGEGHFAWDLEPGSMMTNGTVKAAAAKGAGKELTIAVKDSSQTVTVPANAPVVTLAPADKTDLKAGAPVFLSAMKNAEGQFTAARVTVGKDGVAPPM